MGRIRFLPEVITVCFRKKAGFNYKNNYKYAKLANVWLNIISKKNSKIPIIILYILLRLGSRKL